MTRAVSELARVVRGIRRRTARLMVRASAAIAPAAPPAAPQADEPEAEPIVPEPIRFPTARPLPLPEEWSEAEIREVMSTFRIDASPEGSLQPYVDDALWRFLHTWGMVRDESGRALELGANPYFITWLLHEHTGLDLELANYFGAPAGSYQQLLTYRSRGVDAELPCTFQQFNLEEDRFPYDDGSFEVVVFCEIIEHLLMDPLHSLREIRRVLAPNGLLVLSTPNVARLGNVLSMIEGLNIYDPYSGHGPYGRHNREFTRHELHRLLEFAGFGEITSFTADAHPSHDTTRGPYDAVAPSLTGRADDLGQYVFVAARATAEPRPGLPTMLYRSWPAEQLVEYW